MQFRDIFIYSLGGILIATLLNIYTIYQEDLWNYNPVFVKEKSNFKPKDTYKFIGCRFF